MASSSSASHSVPASMSQSWSYDVFLSFRGEDTRKGFVGHLYTALQHKGIYTYKDDETLPRGESIGPALLKAIEDSRIAVVVFSKNYADSSWCLDELAHIIECVDKRGQILMPIFYQVDPSDVRKLKRKYEEAFSKHERENKENVETWRKALEKAGNISGWTINDTINCHEAKCIRDIVGTISFRLSLLNTNDNKDLIGMETRLRDLKLMLEIGSGGVRMVGIWGVGGGGKTTLASAAYMEISHLFEACCLLENIREESSKHGLKKLQEKILLVALKTTVVVDSEIEGRSMIKRRLCHKRVLVVLDDVDDLEQLEALAGSHDWFGEGSRIIITTRDKHLLSSRAHTNIYEVSLLSHYEAIKLFNRHAYHKDKPIEDYEKLSLCVVSYAGGLPLALKVLGSFLYDKDRDEWKSTLAKLKCIPEEKVMERLKISYDGLEPYQKDLFLDIACFMRRWYPWEMDRAMMVLDACNFYPVIGLKVLEQKSLIKVSKKGRFEMHDLIEEMAHYIVRGEHPNNPEKHSRIWNREDLEELCAMGAAAPSMENEVLTNLPMYISHPGRFDALPNMKNLRWMLWNYYPASSFPSNFQPTKLRCLMLRNSKQEKLWEGCKHLPNLKILDLTDSKNLIRTPDFKGLPCLERLILSDCESLEEIHQSVGYHKRLVFMDMSNCVRLKRFPPIIQMEKLETLYLSDCGQFQQFSDIQANMGLPNLKTLDLQRSCNLIKTPDFEGLPRLERLILSHCESLEEIHPSIGYHKRLVYVNMEGCVGLKRFPPIIHMKKLETLNLRFCEQLQQFPDIQSNMNSLVTLDLCNTGIEIIPPSVGRFCTNLVSLDLSYCYELKRIEGNFHLLKSLKDLHLSNCTGLQSFHQDRLVSLKLPQFPRSLRKLDLSECNLGDGDIPSDICELLNLQVLDLSGNNFSRLPSGLTQIPCLKLLNLSSCKSLVELLDLPSSIAILYLDRCDSLEIVRDLSYYKWLWKVSLGRMIGGERVLLSMLEENAVKDRFMSVLRPNVQPSSIYTKLVTLQLPHNWYTDFSGFLLSVRARYYDCGMYRIVIKQEMSTGHPEEFGEDWKEDDNERVGYVPFGSLRHIPWFNPTSTKNISFQTNYGGGLNVELVRSKINIGDLNEHPIDYSECWDEEYEDNKTFEITYDSKSSEIQISWGW
ncbi:putative TIR domain, P-loop containing nucleoside triphosphate hydrolase [Helianthus annuus]|nr:putative TIR domain, P-loop containing nucleoside triphosphate hydrolase [Helianthus annuus]